jgi:hypothetical protein
VLEGDKAGCENLKIDSQRLALAILFKSLNVSISRDYIISLNHLTRPPSYQTDTPLYSHGELF